MAHTHAKRFVMMGMAAGAAVLMGVFVHAGQVAPAPRNEDVLPALLAEVKGLRAAMEQMASAGPRIQLFVSRLQLQEGRMNTMIRRLDTVRERLAEEQRVLADLQDEVKRFETALASGTAPAAAREEFPQIIAQRKREATTRRDAVARLGAEETQLTQDLAVEQGRWSDINQRLDELERALTKR